MGRTKQPGPARRSADARVGEIKAEARKELAEKGYQAFQPAEVARRCGVSEATVYRYFPTKRDLVSRIAEDWYTGLVAHGPVVDPQADIYTRLRQVLYDTFMVVHRDPALTRFILLELRPDPNYPNTAIYQLNRRFTARVASVVEDAIKAGIFRTDISPKLVRNMIFGCMEHQTWAYLRGEGDFSVEESADGISSLIYRGLLIEQGSVASVLAPRMVKLAENAEALGEEIRHLRSLLQSAAAAQSSASRRTKK
ncbi:MAG: transcriptional regulator, TetR family [Hydrocarboniphaga sp.]|uniref:TetR/AcrR family transcriptional regulator n=1 Tax=Hydrocarboniphaga sp. TaxID=2033016 RepID=UPI002602A9F9|nr:TetR/AcrR family transcriptional regulator [Hydrocarboniphaga sp.]MDB5972538.1 transcriptional regulator, TetR family [Hydrocarboniphaga sp.]